MKRKSMALIFACFALALMAQDGIRVNFKGAQPSISDFVSAFVSSRDNPEEDDCTDEAFNAVCYAWERYHKGIPLEEGQTLTIDEKNGFVVYWRCATGTRLTGNTNCLPIACGALTMASPLWANSMASHSIATTMPRRG